MFVYRVLAIAVAALACTSTPAATPEPPPARPTAGASVAVGGPDRDRRCAETTMQALVAAINDGDEGRLSQLVGTSIWGSLTLSGSTLAQPEEAVAALLERNRAGERWGLGRFDFNGRGWDGGIHFGLIVRRSGPDLPSPYIENAGGGVLDCPEGRLRVLGIGGAVPLRGSERPR